MTAQGVMVYGTLGNMLVAPPALYGVGAPSNSRPGILGQPYFDSSTSPRTGYVWSGLEWLTDSSSTGRFATLTVTGTSTQADINASGDLTFGSATVGVVNTRVTATGASPQVANGRVFTVTFTGVNIAAGATQSFVVTNSEVTAASTVVQYTLVGVTAGGALTIQSVTNASGSSTVVVANGTGATTTTANITLIGQVLTA